MTRPTVHLTAAGASVLLAPAGSGVPVLLHWGRALGDVDVAALAAAHEPGISHSALDAPRATGLVPQNSLGYTGTPAVELFRSVGFTLRRSFLHESGR